MFERYNEKARRTIFFARYEASQFGSPYIESEHMLLGILREDRALTYRFLHAHASIESIRKQIERHTIVREKVSTSVDLPLSNECKHILAYAAEESERLAHQVIGTEHLFLGILREEHSFASELLQQHGLKIDEVRLDIARREPPGLGSHGAHASASTLGFFQLVLRVANLGASIDFYTKLGFREVGQQGPDAAYLTNGNLHLRLDQNPLADHILSFLTPDLTSTVSRLQSEGLHLEQPAPTESRGMTTVLLRDPDGNIISLVNPRSMPPGQLT